MLQPQACLPFATTTYKPDKDGVLRPELPSRCVLATGAQTCSILVDHYRFRKTGPRFPLAVVCCLVHSCRRYTLYPPGHFPYGRQRMAPYSPTGELLVDVDTGQPPWEATIFSAAVQASEGEAWSSESPFDDPRRRRTQGCRLQFAGRLVGVHPQLDGRDRERIATRLAVSTMMLLAGAVMWAKGWKMRGRAIMAVLAGIPLQACFLDRILAAGAVTGLWIHRYPQRWDADRNTWIVAPFPPSQYWEHSRAPAPHGRSPPPTNSPDEAAQETVLPSGS